MVIYNRETNQSQKSIEVYLNEFEIRKLISSLQLLLENPNDQHFHLEAFNKDETSFKELTIAYYSKSNLDSFDKISKNLILEEGEL